MLIRARRALRDPGLRAGGLAPPGGQIFAIAICAGKPENIYVLTGAEPALRFFGWAAVPSPSDNLTVTDIVSPTAQVLIASTHNGVVRSADGGLNWQDANDGWCVTPLAASGPEAFAGTRSHFHSTTSGGAGWTRHGYPNTEARSQAMLVDWGAPPRVWVGTTTGLYVTDDRGSRFEDRSSGGVVDVRAIARLSGGELVVGTADGVYVGSGIAGEWQRRGCDGEGVEDLLVTAGTLLAICDERGQWSKDDGEHWRELSGLAGMRPITLGRTLDGELLVGTRGYGLHRAPAN